MLIILDVDKGNNVNSIGKVLRVKEQNCIKRFLYIRRKCYLSRYVIYRMGEKLFIFVF